MAFVTDALGITGSGPKNEYQATAPTNQYKAQNYAPLNSQAANQTSANEGNAAAAGIQQAQQAGAGYAPLLSQLQATANGQGPNPALEQLKQATRTQQAQAASAIASQRGINPGMQARLIAQNQAAQGQQAAGQAATLQAQQQLAAQGQIAGVLGQQQQGGLGMLSTAGGLQNQQTELGLKDWQATQTLNQQTAAQNAQLNLGAQQINAGIQGQNAQTNVNMLGGLLQGGGAAMAMLSGGGEVPHLAGGGGVFGMGAGPQLGQGMGMPHFAGGGHISGLEGLPWYDLPQYGDPNAGKWQLGGGGKGGGAQKDNPQLANSPDPSSRALGDPTQSPWPGAAPLLDPGALAAVPMARGGQVQAADGPAGPSSHLGRYLSGMQETGAPSAAVDAMARLSRGGPVDYRSGGDVPGRAAVAGDSPKNDTVPAMVSPGEVVLPRSVMQADDAPERAAEFVRKLQRRSGKNRGYEKVAKLRKGGE